MKMVLTLRGVDGQGKWGEAARKLAELVNDDTFRSLEGKSKHQLWLELCDIITKHPKEVQGLKVDAILRSGIRKFTDEVRLPACPLRLPISPCPTAICPHFPVLMWRTMGVALVDGSSSLCPCFPFCGGGMGGACSFLITLFLLFFWAGGLGGGMCNRLVCFEVHACTRCVMLCKRICAHAFVFSPGGRASMLTVKRRGGSGFFRKVGWVGRRGAATFAIHPLLYVFMITMKLRWLFKICHFQ
jgi:hypothetical protein